MRKIRLQVILASAATVLAVVSGCGTAPDSGSKRQSLCDTSINRACSADTCGFYDIHTLDNVLIAEGNLTFSSGRYYAVWNGRDMNNNLVGCGGYLARTTVIINGKDSTMCGNILAGYNNSQLRMGRSSCDSLKSGCPGNYYEAPEEMRFADTGWRTDTGCICCK